MAERAGQMVRALDTPVAYIHYKDLLRANSSDNPATVDCLAEIPRPPAQQPSAGYLKTCGEREITVTFDRPTVDPILWLSLGWFYPIYIPPDATAACYLTWLNAEVVRVDGGAAGARQLDHVSSAQNLAVASNGAVRLDGIGTGLSPTSCEPIGVDTPRGYPAIQVSGLVSSVTISLDHVVQISRLNTRTGEIPRGAVGQPPLALTTSAEVADLGVSTSAPAAVAPGRTFEWTLEATNLGPAASHGFIVADAVPEAVTGVSLVDAPDGCVLDGRDLSCSVASPGWTVSQDAVMPTLANLSGGDPSAVGAVLGAGESFGPITLRGTAPVTPGTEIVTNASVSGVDSDLDLTNNTAQTLTTVGAADWSVAKTVTSSGDTTYPSPGDTLTYTVTATSTTGDVADVVLTDDLTAVLAHADLVPGSVRYTVGSEPGEQLADPTAQDPVVVAGPTSLSAGSTATLSYSVVVHDDAWSTELANTVTATGSTPPSTCAAGSSALDPACSTSTTTAARLELLKQGEVNDELVALDGAAFEVVADAEGALGEVVDSLPVSPVADSPGAFEISGIAPGTYWLRETVAPPGHELLATAVRFDVAADGTVTLPDPASAPQVAASGGRLTVTDVPTFHMPETGSAGAGRLVTVGLLLLAGAVAATAVPGPRSHPLPLTALRKRRR
ncbi:SpaA isopeptide-forming pilin-related protein [Sanguibacter sp. 4.1]|uniref:SpaA isopeptide-forming pilin-related protein n=1 Tax=Sanguibacter biliveldensis TaxID=3030830 RepID=A0AAF0Z0S3_9MICO|nr:SpaA isopeptide-forming pilin-related protein [Sanguibacter sp. 4.1]WPF80783.1 SpaA isopeptide-forming pilin-related protein [Sanguibacter sp. 4.1]